MLDIRIDVVIHHSFLFTESQSLSHHALFLSLDIFFSFFGVVVVVVVVVVHVHVVLLLLLILGWLSPTALHVYIFFSHTRYAVPVSTGR